jgi:hypothetical protein
MTMKIFNIVFGALCLVAAALQYNDPDPYIWIPIYLYAAILCFLAAGGKFYPVSFLIGIAVYAAYAGYLFFTRDGVLDWINEHNAESLQPTMKASTPWIEQTREFIGLVLLIIVLYINFGRSKRRHVR